MERKSVRMEIPGPHGRLAAILETPVDQPKAIGLFAHCFSCTKDLKAIVKISRALAEKGYAIVRFDFAGLGQSDGNFSETTFLDNINDVRAVIEYVSREIQPPHFLVGHSLGGSAMMVAATEFDFVEAVSVIASPADTTHLAETIYRINPEVEERGEGMVNTGTYNYLIKKPTIDVLRNFDLPAKLKELHKRILVFHSTADQTLGFEHAEAIVGQTPGSASIVNLENANHLLTDDPRDVEFIAATLANWLDRFISR